MDKAMKKALSLFLIFVMIFSLLPLSALAAEEETTEDAVDETTEDAAEESTEETTTEETTNEAAEEDSDKSAEKIFNNTAEKVMENASLPLDGDSVLLDSGTCGENLTWTLTSDGVLTISGEGEMARLSSYNYQVPWERHSNSITNVVIKNGVASIDRFAFSECSNLQSVTIPSSVKTIGAYAFFECTELKEVSIPEGVETIGTSAFHLCTSLESITIPASVTQTGSTLFTLCSSLKSIAFSEGTTTIKTTASDSESDMLFNCKAERITIPSTVTSIQTGFFKNCPELKTIEVAAENQNYKSIDGVLFSADGKTLLAYPLGKENTSYVMPDGVENVAEYSFYCDTFYFSSKLENIIIPPGVKTIGEWAFYGVNLNTLVLPSGLLSIGEYAFGCNQLVENIIIPASVTSIGEGAFCWCNELEAINVESENTVYTSVDGVLFNKEKTALCFYPTGKGVDFGTYTVPKGVERIWDHAFSRLTNIMIPESVTTVGYESFTGGMVNPSMDIFYEGTEEQWKNIAIENLPLDDWNNPLDRAVIHYGVDYSSVVATGRCGDDVLWQLDTTGELTVYGSGAVDNGRTFFWCCSGYENLIRSVTVCKGVSALGVWAFENCENIESVTLAEGMTSIDFGLFQNCHSLETVVIPVSMVSIGNAFNGCTKLKEVHYAGTKTQWNQLEINTSNECLFTATIICTDGTIEPGGNCGTNLQWTLSTDGVLTISGNGEMYNYGTVYISGNDSLYFGSPSPWFGARGRISTVVIEHSVTGIGENAFAHCTALASVYYGGTEAEKNAISINSGNTPLTDATWHYGETGPTVSTALVAIGKAVGGKVVVTVTVNGKPLTEGTNYTFTSKTDGNGMISVTVVGCGSYTGSITETLDHTPGDMDGNGVTNIMDVLALLKSVAGITGKLDHGDVNADGTTNIMDVLTLLKYVAGIAGSLVY